MTAIAERDQQDRKLWDAILEERKLPGVLHRAIEGVWKYRDDPESLRPLARVTQLMKEEAQRSKRQNRRDGRIAESWVLLSLLINTDLTTLQVGYPGKNGAFVHRSCKFLAESVGMADPVTGKPCRRYQRAFKRLQNAALMRQFRRAEEHDSGAITQKSAIKSMSSSLVVALLGGTKKAEEALSKARGEQYAYNKANPKPLDPESAKAAERDALFSSVEAQIKPKAKPLQEASQEAPTDAPAITATKDEAKYRKARSDHQKRLLDSGLDFKELHAQMKAFPTFEVWQAQA